MSPGRREAHRMEMRARLLAAALHLFGARGYDATTIDQIAERADVARQTVLNHYPHKRDFLRAWGQQRRDRLLAIAEDAGPDEAGRAQLHRYFAALAGMNEQERELTRALYMSLPHDDVRIHQRPVPDAVVAAIDRGQRRGEFDPGVPPSTAAEVITAVYFDTLTRWLTGGDRPFDLATALSDRLDVVLAGLARR
jgi:AcrR family transcriptional regulator